MKEFHQLLQMALSILGVLSVFVLALVSAVRRDLKWVVLGKREDSSDAD
jgi:hypothetical protein